MESTHGGASGEELLAQRTSASHVLKHLIRATAGFAVAHLVTRLLLNWLRGQHELRGSELLVEVPVYLLVAGVALTATSAIPILRDLQEVKRLVSENEQVLARQATSQRFLRDVQDAFEMAETEEELFEIAEVALGESAHSALGGAEILVADSSGAHVSRAVVSTVGEAPGCAVPTPGSCPAVRRGQTARFEDPEGLAACPWLRKRPLGESMGSTCIPVTILGAPSAVLHTTYEFIEDPVEYEKKVTTLEGTAMRFGARLGMLRAMSQSQLQADTDPLTGLLNRRAMENRARALRGEGRRFAVAMLDLDHFKDLNDAHGHDTGDRALRLFARVLTEAFRDGDIVCRYGGEEFLVILPGIDVNDAAPVMHRLRARLLEDLAHSQVPPFTVSIGLCDSSWADDLHEVITAADRALLTAKAEGRDRIVIDDPDQLPRATVAAPPSTITTDPESG